MGECGEPLVDSGPKYVVIGEEYGRVLGILQNRYPNIEFVPWHLALSRFAEIATQKMGEQYTASTLTSENRPYYDPPIDITPASKPTTKVAEDNANIHMKGESDDDWIF